MRPTEEEKRKEGFLKAWEARQKNSKPEEPPLDEATTSAVHQLEANSTPTTTPPVVTTTPALKQDVFEGWVKQYFETKFTNDSSFDSKKIFTSPSEDTTTATHRNFSITHNRKENSMSFSGADDNLTEALKFYLEAAKQMQRTSSTTQLIFQIREPATLTQTELNERLDKIDYNSELLKIIRICVTPPAIDEDIAGKETQNNTQQIAAAGNDQNNGSGISTNTPNSAENPLASILVSTGDPNLISRLIQLAKTVKKSANTNDQTDNSESIIELLKSSQLGVNDQEKLTPFIKELACQKSLLPSWLGERPQKVSNSYHGLILQIEAILYEKNMNDLGEMLGNIRKGYQVDSNGSGMLPRENTINDHEDRSSIQNALL